MIAKQPTESNSTSSICISEPQELLGVVLHAAVTLVEQLHALRLIRPEALPSLWAERIAAVQEVVDFLDSDGCPPTGSRRSPQMSMQQRCEFGRLLRDRRSAAGLSRLELARKAQLSDSTVKFIETARHQPSRASLIRLLNVSALSLGWADVPGQPYSMGASASSQTALHERRAVIGGCLVILDRLDFDELGDPVAVRRLICRAQADAGNLLSPGQDLSQQARCPAIDFVPLRRLVP